MMEQGDIANLQIPLKWLITTILTLGSAIIMGIGWWIVRELRRNDDEHVQFERNLRSGNDQLHTKIDALDMKIERLTLHLMPRGNER